jgi:ketosteroid isomerase-like protein
MEKKEQIIREYFNAWIENTVSILPALLAEDIAYSECYGPEYHGLEQILQWFSDWHGKGKVLEWRIKQFIHQKDIVAAEWYFECDYENNTDGFDGVSIIAFNQDNKITSVKEFQSKARHYYPYG